MSTTQTTNLGLTKATPGTGEPFSTSVVNTNLDTIDSAVGELQDSVVCGKISVDQTLSAGQEISRSVTFSSAMESVPTAVFLQSANDGITTQPAAITKNGFTAYAMNITNSNKTLASIYWLAMVNV